jgi:thioredoxin 1
MGAGAVPENEVVTEASDQTFEAVVEKEILPVVVMFSSRTCPFCRAMEPYFFQYASEFLEKIRFVKVDVVGASWTAERYGIRSTPTFKFFCSGRPVTELVGAVYPAILKRTLEESLLSGRECIRNSSEINYDITGYG